LMDVGKKLALACGVAGFHLELSFEPNAPGTRETTFPERKGEARPGGQRASPRAVTDGGFPLRLERGEDAR
jgi:hypothetical protein